MAPSMQLHFGGVAPQIQRFSLAHPDFMIDLSALRLSQLRHLKVLYCEHPLSSWLDALSTMHLLESLQMIDAILFPPEIEMTSGLSVARLPSLREIHVFSRGLVQICTFFDHIMPAPGCCLQMQISVMPEGPSPTSEQLTFINRVLSRFLESWINTTTHVGPLELSSFESNLYISASSSDSRTLFININGVPSIIAALEAFSRCKFSDITSLSFYSEVNPANQHLASFLLRLTKVTVLEVPYPSFEGLTPENPDMSASHVPFPDLSRVVLTSLARQESQQWRDMCVRFFRWRHSMGCPIEIFDLTEAADRLKLLNFAALDAISGLQIKWTDNSGNIKTYLCGSGNVNVLEHWDEIGAMADER
ncbi:unnamed protein product [Cyclocybe aegerita]|uniref:Uncharacterized protein n=1 Tax=Cyclocybe aegerita TaxID=1973307 RepID=A0A8S0W2A0_CYCAE|nr:unnamed protein product [Cyclocybe aegerita]